MSSFLSNKLLQYRKGPERRTPIAEDRFCASCGYNMRGLTTGRNCPECGTPMVGDAASGDFLLSGEWSDRRKVRLGLTLIVIALLAEVSGRLGMFNWLVFANMSAPVTAYRWFIGAMSVAWAMGVWFVTPPRMNAARPRRRWLRLAARWLQWFWPVANALAMVASYRAALGAPVEGLILLAWLAQVLAWIGAMFAIYLMLRLAFEAELEDATARLNLALWLLPVPTVILALVPGQVFWVGLLLIGPTVLFWCWCMTLLLRGVLTMQRHVSWALRLAADSPNRALRQMQTRKDLDDAVAAQIRPTEQAKQPDLPLEGSRRRPTPQPRVPESSLKTLRKPDNSGWIG